MTPTEAAKILETLIADARQNASRLDETAKHAAEDRAHFYTVAAQIKNIEAEALQIALAALAPVAAEAEPDDERRWASAAFAVERHPAPLDPNPKTGQAIVVTSAGVQIVPHTADLIAFMEARGHVCIGQTGEGRLRPELQWKPRFAGLVGPMWGGEDHPLRYEDAETNDMLSR